MKAKKVINVNYAINESHKLFMRTIRTNKNFLKFVKLFLQYIPKDPRLKSSQSNKNTTINSKWILNLQGISV